ncbi:hypothetical protein SAMN05428975_2480 [Mucilaginibacter sp. OK268]|jgi:hypothetical protein|uniref:hypothetical protein n=1 Tax=Mucilaginibacter sp. OK268 TaxID=1881048 RepID=UPI00087E8539|nr:hypothetical protein [Mucilaginibacter sp. OK268]SDP74739.1 hypothetical protein SAMN05428975_2480 [Mucilaginibacter sp. OK268]
MAISVQQINYLTTTISAVLGSSILTAIVSFYLNKVSFKNNKAHENKIIEVKNFYKSYQAFKLGVEDYYNYTMFRFTIKDTETAGVISSSLTPLLRDFQYESMIVKLFLDEKDYLKITELEKVLFQIKQDIDIFHVNVRNPNSIDSGKRMSDIREIDLEKTLPELMKIIEVSLRKEFK